MKLRKKLGLLKKKRGQLIKLFNEIKKKNRTSKKHRETEIKVKCTVQRAVIAQKINRP
jgi:hypothetical protein